MHKVRWVVSYGFVENFMSFPAVQNCWKSIKIWQSYKQLKGANFFWDTVYDIFASWLSKEFINVSVK